MNRTCTEIHRDLHHAHNPFPARRYVSLGSFVTFRVSVTSTQELRRDELSDAIRKGELKARRASKGVFQSPPRKQGLLPLGLRRDPCLL
jgi:hypothetical protein